MVVLVLFILLCQGICPATSSAQGGSGVGILGGTEPTGQYPPPQYYYALQTYRSGDLPLALDAFENALRGSRRDVNGRMIDAIPALAMLGECHWHLGNLPAARECSDQIINIATRYRGWIGSVDWDSSVRTGATRTKPSWLWPEAASVNRIAVADKIMLSSGAIVTREQIARGGVIEEPNLRPMDIVEIMRGIAIAAYRRRIILGPLAEDDAGANALVEATKFPANLNIPVARSLIGSMRTAGYFAEHDEKNVLEEAARSATAGGVHPVSAIAMQCQASTLAASDQPAAVVAVAANVANAAAVLEQPEWVGEAMQLAAGCATSAQAAQVAKMATTAAAALSRESRLATLHCLIAGADAAVTAGNIEGADGLLNQAGSVLSRRDVTQPRLEVYGAYVAARIAAARGASIGGDGAGELQQALSTIEGFTLNHRDRKRSLVSMPRLYQLNLVRQSVGGSTGASTGDQWLKYYCDQPTIDVWRRDPVDAISGWIVDRSDVHALRINLVASGGYAEETLQAVDAMLAARFVDRQPVGGRMTQIRAIARADDQLLAPEIAEVRKAAGPLMAELRNAATNGAKPDPATAAAMEAKAMSLALDRISLPQYAVPLLNQKLPVATLPKGTALVTFTYVGNRLYATMSSEGKVEMWNVPGAARLSGDIGRLLSAIGVGKVRGKRLPEDDGWKKLAIGLRKKLFPDDDAVSPERVDRLVIVPDGPLWYLPFEILPIDDEESALMVDQISIRYAPTPGFAIKPTAMPPTSRIVGIATKQFFAPRDPDVNESIVQSMIDVIAEPMRLPESLDVPTGLLGEQVGHLVVASARPVNTKEPLQTSLAAYDQSSSFGTTGAWLRFPAPVPRSVALFGLRTPVDVGQMGSGDEVFTTVCGLHAAGVRSVLLSRWAVGGESSAILLREFLQELPFAGMNQSFERARLLLRGHELDPAAEPLITQAEHDRQGITGDQPIFWSGYLVSSPPKPAAEKADPAEATREEN